MLLSSSVQPSIISLFSSTSSDPLALFSSTTDHALLGDSFIHFLHDRLSCPLPGSMRTLLHLPTINKDTEQEDSQDHGVELEQTVLHIQSPTIRTTYIQCPPLLAPYGDISIHDRSTGLGIRHPWMHLQVRNLGREWSVEVGVVDHAGRSGTIRLSTFQVNFDFLHVIFFVKASTLHPGNSGKVFRKIYQQGSRGNPGFTQPTDHLKLFLEI